MSAPQQKPGRSRQDYQTPREFLEAVESRFGQIAFDLAANVHNKAVQNWYGPDSPHAVDALSVAWGPGRVTGDLLWLNPPFGMLDAFAAKCAEESSKGARIVMLSPASIGTDWFREHVLGRALVLGLSPRITFVGEEDPYPKDLMLTVWGPWSAPGLDCWRWKGKSNVRT